MISYNKFILIMVFLSFLTLSACSSTKEKTFGEKLLGQGAELEEIGEKWSDGEKLVVDGVELVEEGEPGGVRAVGLHQVDLDLLARLSIGVPGPGYVAAVG